ncbi:MAG: trypsin-like peptidase domain-containing protein [Oligoflexales bacterium]
MSAILYCGGATAAIYGNDDRADLSGAESEEIKQIASSVAILVPQSQITDNAFGRASVLAANVKNRYNLCSSDPFSDQPSIGFCSAFLATEDTLVTAGHCIPNANACRQTAFIFDFDANSVPLTPDSISVNSDNIYYCQDIISRAGDSGRGKDFAVIRLDRKTNRRPLRLRKSGQAPLGLPVTSFGFPNGSLLKVTSGASIRDNAIEQPYFVTNIDGFPGNSGSVVLGPDKQVEGILVRGEKAYAKDVRGCSKPIFCENYSCRGEDVVKTETFIHYLPRTGPKLILKDTKVEETQGNGNGVLEPGEQGIVKLTIENRGLAPASDVKTTLRSLTDSAQFSDEEVVVPIIRPNQSVEFNAQTLQIKPNANCNKDILFELIASSGDEIFAHKGDVQLGIPDFVKHEITPNLVLEPYLPSGQELFIQVPEGANRRKVSFGVEIEHVRPEEMILSVRSPEIEYSSILYLQGRSQQMIVGEHSISPQPLNGNYGSDNEPYESIAHFSQVNKPGLWSFQVKDLGFGNAGTVKRLSVMFENRICQ